MPSPLVLLTLILLAVLAWLAVLTRQRESSDEFWVGPRQTLGLMIATLQGKDAPEGAGRIGEVAVASVFVLFAVLCPLAFLFLGTFYWGSLDGLHSAIALLTAAATLIGLTIGYFFLTESRIGTGRLKARPVTRHGSVAEALDIAAQLEATADREVRGVWSFAAGPEVENYFSEALTHGAGRVQTLRIADLGLSDAIIIKHIQDNWENLKKAEKPYKFYLTLGVNFEMLVIDTKDALLFSPREQNGTRCYQYDPLPATAAKQLFDDLLQKARRFDLASPNSAFQQSAVETWLIGARAQLKRNL